MRGLSELYSALILFAVAALITPAVYRTVVSYSEALRAEQPPLRLVYKVNESYALCITVDDWRPSDTLSIGNFSFWVYIQDVDGDGLLDPQPGSPGSPVSAGTYVLVTPPWPCK